jgi:CubicO group peptidase (beta-lactamase class C family)
LICVPIKPAAASPINLSVAEDPSDLGFDAGRLERIGHRFDSYVDNGQITGYSIAIGRGGEPAWLKYSGLRDKEANLPVDESTVFRWYSMTKPVTAVAAMMLWEEGKFELTDPISKYIPSFGDSRIFVKGTATAPVTMPVREPVRIWHLLAHMAGMTYGFLHSSPVDLMYRQKGYEWGAPDVDLAQACDDWAAIPLLFEPGSEWCYSVGTDVIGRLVEVVSGMSLSEFFGSRIFGPLGMTETGFGARPDQMDRLAALYIPIGPTQQATRFDAMGAAAHEHNPKLLSGGGGLVGTLGDYFRFQQMLSGAGEVDGIRLLAPRTVERMAANHLPNNSDLEQSGRPLFAETNFSGVGFGLGVSTTVNPTATGTSGSVGDFGWGGAASTWMLVDPIEDLTVTFMTQLLPSSTHPFRTQLRQAVYQAIID